ncbi:MAG: M20/M25/M40 family metallo-hydrolase [Candidatus Nanohaloarchaea archaeon]|nr:M20/M25/M40 family metallo-hydrolase [Candidatus Nanohaloarchaea archaeon]
MQGLLKELVETPGVSGGEAEVREFIEDELQNYADEVETDSFNNLVARKGDGDTTLMVVAHMDQIGLSVKDLSVSDIRDDGYLEFAEIGGINEDTLYNQHVTVHTDDDEYHGIIGLKPPHMEEESSKLYVDIGADSREEVEDLGIEKGDYITWDRGLEELQNDYVTGPALDNRVGCTVAIDAFKEFDEDYELITVFSTQEEVGLKGAKTAAYDIDPDAALAVDVSVGDEGSSIDPGEGVDITLMQGEGRGLMTPESVKDWLVETAENEGHDYQLSMTEGGYTDAAKIELAKDGIPTGSLGVPLEYMHSATEKVSLGDMEATSEYLQDVYETFEDHF